MSAARYVMLGLVDLSELMPAKSRDDISFYSHSIIASPGKRKFDFLLGVRAVRC